MIDSTPFKKFDEWLTEAKETEDTYPEAFTLATATSDGVPSARIVLLKKVSSEGFIFFTNYNSEKSEELLENPNAHMLFYWKSLKKQVRVRGVVSKASSEISDAYWAQRAPESNLRSSLSKQSEIIEEGFDFSTALQKLKEEHPDGISRPENWGGFVIRPQHFEFWTDGANRWHKRETFTLNGNGAWETSVLYP